MFKVPNVYSNLKDCDILIGHVGDVWEISKGKSASWWGVTSGKEDDERRLYENYADLQGYFPSFLS
jgi:hypothetical protein